MEGDTLIDSDSGSFDSLTFLPTGGSPETRLTKKRSFDSISDTAPPPPSTTPSTTTTPTTSALKRGGDLEKEKKKRKVSFMINEMKQAELIDVETKLSAEEIAEMKRKTEHWWRLPAGTTQEEFDYAFDHFKEGRYFAIHMEVEWMDVQIQRACARVLSQDQFSAAAQDLCGEIHAAMTRNNAERVETLAQGDPELIQLTQQYKAASADLLEARQTLTDKFGVIHSAKIAIKSEVYVCSATRLKQAGKEVTDAAVEEELAAFERGQVTVPGSQPQGGCIMAQGYRGPPIGVASPGGTCPVQFDNGESDQPQPPQSPQAVVAHPPPASVCPFTGRKAATSGEEGLQMREVESTTLLHTSQARPAAAVGVCPYTGHKAPTSGEGGVQAREEDD